MIGCSPGLYVTRSLTIRNRLVNDYRAIDWSSSPYTTALRLCTIDELRHLVEAAWPAVLVHAIQSVYDSMSRDIQTIIAAGSASSRY